jgi:hypothetical protein
MNQALRSWLGMIEPMMVIGANVSITLDRYGRLTPGNEDEAAALLDDYLERSTAEKAQAAEVSA